MAVSVRGVKGLVSEKEGQVRRGKARDMTEPDQDRRRYKFTVIVGLLGFDQKKS